MKKKRTHSSGCHVYFFNDKKRFLKNHKILGVGGGKKKQVILSPIMQSCQNGSKEHKKQALE